MLPDLTDSEVGRISMAPYSADNFREHFAAVTRGDSDPALIETLICQLAPDSRVDVREGREVGTFGRGLASGRGALCHPQQRRNERVGVGARTGSDVDHSVPARRRDDPV